MKRAFTLIELMIVITIIGILMGVTMKFGSNRIVDLKAQSLKDTFIDSYQFVQSQNLASSYHNSVRYTRLDIAFSSGILATYDGSGSTQLLSDTAHMLVKNINGTPILSLTPYHMGCVLSGSTTTGLAFDLEVNGNKTYCFTITLTSCKLKEIPCLK